MGRGSNHSGACECQLMLRNCTLPHVCSMGNVHAVIKAVGPVPTVTAGDLQHMSQGVWGKADQCCGLRNNATESRVAANKPKPEHNPPSQVRSGLLALWSSCSLTDPPPPPPPPAPNTHTPTPLPSLHTPTLHALEGSGSPYDFLHTGCREGKRRKGPRPGWRGWAAEIGRDDGHPPHFAAPEGVWVHQGSLGGAAATHGEGWGGAPGVHGQRHPPGCHLTATQAVL